MGRRFNLWTQSWEKGFISLQHIQYCAQDTLRIYAQLCGHEVVFPLDAEDIVRRVFDLEVYYDGEGFLDKIDPELLAVLYADGDLCPLTGRDKTIVINDAQRFRNVTTAHSILHETGHYIFDFLRGRRRTNFYTKNRTYCHTKDMEIKKPPPPEWRANRYAGEVCIPMEKVIWILDGKKPGDVINVKIYKQHFREFFGVSQAAMEKRLSDLGYKLFGVSYEWADWLKRERKGP